MRLNSNLRRLIEAKSAVSPEASAQSINDVAYDFSSVSGDLRSALGSLDALRRLADSAGDDAFAAKVRDAASRLERLDDAFGKIQNDLMGDALESSELFKISKRVPRGWNPKI